MNRIFLLLLLLCASVLTAFSQPTVNTGAPYKHVEATEAFYFNRGGEILAVKVAPKNVVTLQKLSAGTLAVTSTQPYTDFPKDAFLEHVISMKGHYYVLYCLWDNNQLYAREIDFAKGTFIGAARMIVDPGQKLNYLPGKPGFDSDTDNYALYFSADSSVVAVHYRFAKNDKKGNDRIGLHVFAPTLTEKWHGVATLPYPEPRMEIMKFFPDATGQVYAVARVFDDLKAREKNNQDDAHYTLEAFKLPMGTGAATKLDLALDGKFLKSLTLRATPKGALLGAGFYTNTDALVPADGMAVFTVDGNGKATDIKRYDIPSDLRKQYGGDKPEEELNHMAMQECIVLEDGGLLLVGEQTYFNIEQRSSIDPLMFHHYEDILLTRIDGSGKLSWMYKIPKFQQGMGTDVGAMSYRYVRGGDTHYFLYLDNEKNKSLTIAQAPARHANGVGGFLVAFGVNDKTREVTKSVLFDIRDIHGHPVPTFNPHTLVVPQPGMFVFEAPGKKEDVLKRVVFTK